MPLYTTSVEGQQRIIYRPAVGGDTAGIAGSLDCCCPCVCPPQGYCVFDMKVRIKSVKKQTVVEALAPQVPRDANGNCVNEDFQEDLNVQEDCGTDWVNAYASHDSFSMQGSASDTWYECTQTSGTFYHAGVEDVEIACVYPEAKTRVRLMLFYNYTRYSGYLDDCTAQLALPYREYEQTYSSFNLGYAEFYCCLRSSMLITVRNSPPDREAIVTLYADDGVQTRVFSWDNEDAYVRYVLGRNEDCSASAEYGPGSPPGTPLPDFAEDIIYPEVDIEIT